MEAYKQSQLLCAKKERLAHLRLCKKCNVNDSGWIEIMGTFVSGMHFCTTQRSAESMSKIIRL
jgi:hypothetical protein